MKFLIFLSGYALITSIAVATVLKELPPDFGRLNGNSRIPSELLK
jgi:hypothetical protein